MKNAIMTAVMAATILMAGCGKRDSSSSNPATPPAVHLAIEGEWICESATADGKPMDEDTAKLLTLTVTKNRYIQKRGADIVWDAEYALDASQDPPHIDIIDKGDRCQGICTLANDTLKVCYTQPGKARPTRFDSMPGSGAMILVWKRQKP